MDTETFDGSDLHLFDDQSTEELIAFAFGSAQELLGLDKTQTYPDRVNILRLFDNLAKMLGGDDKLMRYWMGSKNVHLGYVPVDHAHDPLYLEEINAYLEAILHN
jgi:hypothetical protein